MMPSYCRYSLCLTFISPLKNYRENIVKKTEATKSEDALGVHAFWGKRVKVRFPPNQFHRLHYNQLIVLAKKNPLCTMPE